jgi:hypothetical protein
MSKNNIYTLLIIIFLCGLFSYIGANLETQSHVRRSTFFTGWKEKIFYDAKTNAEIKGCLVNYVDNNNPSNVIMTGYKKSTNECPSAIETIKINPNELGNTIVEIQKKNNTDGQQNISIILDGIQK